MAKAAQKKTYTAGGQKLKITKDPYTWLWNVWYDDYSSSPKWAGPFKTKKEAVEMCERAADEEDNSDITDFLNEASRSTRPW